jgi:hypothetical protein
MSSEESERERKNTDSVINVGSTSVNKITKLAEMLAYLLN